MLLPAKLSRYGAVAKLFLKHRSALALNASSTVRLKPDATYMAVADETEPARLAADLEKLGPTFVKLGRIEADSHCGYPGFPTLLFLVAGSLGLWLAFTIVAHDRTPRKCM